MSFYEEVILSVSHYSPTSILLPWSFSPSPSSPLSSSPSPFIVDGGEISVLFTQKIRAELGRRRLFCDDGDKIGDAGVSVCVCVGVCRATLPYLSSRRSSHMKLFIVITHGKSRFHREI